MRKGMLISVIYSLLFAFFFQNSLIAQPPTDSTINTFYDFMDHNYIKHIDSTYLDTAEGSEERFFSRLLNRWYGPLYPHGDFSIAAKAMTQYSRDFEPFIHSNHASRTTCSANWRYIGRIGQPRRNDKIYVQPQKKPTSVGQGQIHCIAFDPEFNISNQRMYAGSPFCGIWYSDDAGLNWNVLNSDNQLPFTSVSHIAVDPSDGNIIYITTGDGDRGLFLESGVNRGQVNPITTSGVYRSEDRGITWHPINGVNHPTANDLLDLFENGGTIRKIIINGNDVNQGFIASSVGILRCDNLRDAQPEWEIVYQGSNPTPGDMDRDFKGLNYKPDGSYQVLYASGKDIYQSTDNGNTWDAITTSPGNNISGLDLNDRSYFPGLTDPDNKLHLYRINIAVTPADPNRVYALLRFQERAISDNDKITQHSYIFMYDELQNSWNHVYSLVAGSQGGHRIALVASPLNADEVFFGEIRTHGTYDINLPDGGFSERGYKTAEGYHSDVHALEYEPNTSTPMLFCGNDGGVSIKDIGDPTIYGWQYRNEGFQIGKLWSFDDSEFNADIIIGAYQDVGTNVTRWNATEQKYLWEIIERGDGYGARINDENPNIHHFREKPIYRFDHAASIKTNEQQLKPDHPADGVTENIEVTFPLENHPYTGKPFWGMNDIWRRNYSVPPANQPQQYTKATMWSLESDIKKFYPPGVNWTRAITEFKFAPSNPEYVYAVVKGVHMFDNPLGFNVPPKLMRSTTGTNNGNYYADKFEDITHQLPELIEVGSANANSSDPFYPLITGIAVDPENEHRMWVAMTSYEEDKRVWFTEDGGNTKFETADPQNSIPMPVNAIAYQSGTNDRLFIGTDVGVYTKCADDTEWQRFGDFPNVRVTELKINYCKGVLRAATYGRGIWEADICESNGPAHVRLISSGQHQIWDTEKGISGNIEIESGGSLTIRSTISMPKDGKIIVRKGGRLYVETDGVLTNNCGEMWKGIFVEGDKQISPPSLSNIINNQLIIAQDYAHGAVHINGGIVEHSYWGIQTMQGEPGEMVANSGGGVVLADRATFRNNRTDVGFNDYDFTNISQFNHCSFITDDEFRGNKLNAHISMWKVKGVSITACNFENLNPDLFLPTDKGVGIRSIDASYKVLPECVRVNDLCDPNTLTPSTFRNLNRGVVASNSGFNPGIPPIKINYCDFFNVQRGVCLRGVEFPQITLNKFDFDNAIYIEDFVSPHAYNIYLEGCSDYLVTENTMTSSGINSNLEFLPHGIIVNNRDKYANERIYKNSIDNLYGAITGMGTNGSNSPAEGPLGLLVKCNDLSDNKWDITVAKGDNGIGNALFYGFNIWNDPGASINPQQGYCSTGSNPPSPVLNHQTPANNLLSITNCGPGVFEWNLGADNATLPVVYTPADASIQHYPQCIGNSSVYTISPLACGTTYVPGDGPTSSCPRLDLSDSYKKERRAIENTITDLRRELTTRSIEYPSPRLVSMTNENVGAIRESGEFTEIVGNEILDPALQIYLSSHSLFEFIQYIVQHTSLDFATIQQMLGAFLPYSSSDINPYLIQPLKNELAHWNAELDHLLSIDISNFLERSELDSIIILLGGDTSVQNMKQLLPVYIAKNQLREAGNVLTSLRSKNRSDLKDYIDYYQLILDLKQANISLENLSSRHISQIEAFATSEYTIAYKSVSFLEWKQDDTYGEPFPQISSLPAKLQIDNIQDEVNNVIIYPNPTNEFLRVKFHSDNISDAISIDVYDLNGNKIYEEFVAEEGNINHSINTSYWKAGMYIIRISVNDKTIIDKKIEVFH